jgi:hypothetical protein
MIENKTCQFKHKHKPKPDKAGNQDASTESGQAPDCRHKAYRQQIYNRQNSDKKAKNRNS